MYHVIKDFQINLVPRVLVVILRLFSAVAKGTTECQLFEEIGKMVPQNHRRLGFGEG